jgi:acetyltransferase-like isoleucine patch superfamily enzyme
MSKLKTLFILISRPKLILTKLKVYFDFYYLKFHGVETRKGYVVLHGLPLIKKYPGSKIIIGKGSTLVSKSKYNVAGINHRVILATMSESAVIKIGTVGISGASICASNRIEIGDQSGIGANSKLYDSDFHILDPLNRLNGTGEIKTAPITVEENVWIASDVIILKGVTIGKGSVIGAGSVVTKSIASFEVHAGNPARKIRDLKAY